MRIVALVPAHNEADGIRGAVAGLLAQTRVPDEIVVVCDNCTDDTDRIARGAGARTIRTAANTAKKAGALNQALAGLLPDLADDDVVLVQDADSRLDPTFIESGLAAYNGDIGGVGGVFRGRIDASSLGGRLLQAYQANEYARYELDIRRQEGRVLVLTGTATLLRVGILREVIRARQDGRLPGAPGVYDTTVLTEDNELSFALLHLGYRLISPVGCTLDTETMPTWLELARQRGRWKRGAIENLAAYGWTRHTRGYWGRQALALAGLVVTVAYLMTLAFGLVVGFHLQTVWLVVTALFGAERAFTVRRRGARAMLVASTVVAEMAYDLFLQMVQARAFVAAAVGSERRW